jgi:hypothetical protein
MGAALFLHLRTGRAATETRQGKFRMLRRASRETGTKPWTTCPPSTATTPLRTATKSSAWLTGTIGAAPRQVRPGLRSGHGVICTCLIPGERGFGKKACLVAAPTASGPGGSRTSTLAITWPSLTGKSRAGCRRSKVWSQVWSQARGAQCAYGEANKTRATDHGLAKPGRPPGPVATTPALRRPPRCRARDRPCRPTPRP